MTVSIRCKLATLTLLYGFIVRIASAQYVAIPDSNFRVWLNANGYSQCMNGNLMDTTCNAIVNATYVDCNYSSIGDLSGIQYFDHLYTLTCQSNYYLNIPALPNSLTFLYCENSAMSTLPPLPNMLTHLYCEGNYQLHTLPALPTSLTFLRCYNNHLTSLPSLPNSLQHLECRDNDLNTLPSLPNSLTYLDCQYNHLSSLPVLPSFLDTLNCGGNLLTSLPTLPNSLTILECSNNQLSNIPILSNGLKNLGCDGNNLNTLPALPHSLQSLTCCYNQLTTLPTLPNSLTKLLCGHNPQFNTMPEFPDSLNILQCDTNPNLHCFPLIKRIVQFYFPGTPISCFPDYGNVTSSDPLLTLIPICDSLNANGCQVFNSIKEISATGIILNPNPANGLCNLCLNSSGGFFSASVLDATGRLIMPLFNNERISTFTLNIDLLSSGLYFVKVSDEQGGIAIKKLIKK